jgi:hypothetical protein
MILREEAHGDLLREAEMDLAAEVKDHLILTK